MPFNKDFGPLNLAMMHKYVKELARLLQDESYKDFKIFHYCSDKYDKIANSAFLMGAFLVIVMKQTPEEAWRRFRSYEGMIRPFRDAAKGECRYACTVLHCLQGLAQGLRLGWYDFRQFNAREYEHYEKVEHGDINWIVPGKFAACMGPVGDRRQGRAGCSPEEYCRVFREWGIRKVVRLNEAHYDREDFVRNGVSHADLFFVDGSNPPDEVAAEFLRTCERHFATPNAGAIAVHCKAGLGRTGTLIGLYAMKHYQIPAEQFIGWIRLARPGSILGPQQFYLLDKEVEYLNPQLQLRKAQSLGY